MLWPSTRDPRASAPQTCDQSQKGSAGHARGRTWHQAPQALCAHDRQPARLSDLPQPVSQHHPRSTGQGWVADFTYIRVAIGFCYLAVILDACSRKVVGYALSRHLDTELALAALRAAVISRNPPKGCIHHADSQKIVASSWTV
ncbi:DDE-type integrase/transposase/recombinase [Paracoccus acridae]|uniref:DDE-type integrase/transposase/recombinase n=1 Tax=Paracoccus acridae TaxID=1795310 RepID=UPI0034D4B08A